MPASEKVVHLRAQCTKLGIKFHPAHRAVALQRLLDDYKRDKAVEALEMQKASGAVLPGMEKVKQPTSLPHQDYKYGRVEVFLPPRNPDIPEDVLDSIDLVSGFNIAAANLISRYLDTIQHAPVHA